MGTGSVGGYSEGVKVLGPWEDVIESSEAWMGKQGRVSNCRQAGLPARVPAAPRVQLGLGQCQPSE